MALHVVILAAGQGTRMQSKRSKVLHPLGGQPLIGHVVQVAHQLQAAAVHVVIAPGQADLETYLKAQSVQLVYQKHPQGTGDALAAALPQIPDDAHILVLYGDTPLLTVKTLQNISLKQSLALLTTDIPHPFGYGRIVREHDQILGIVEEKDATPEQKTITEVNTGILQAPAHSLKNWISRLNTDNSQGEYYLTDIVGLAVQDQISVVNISVDNCEEVQGINTRSQLAMAERILQKKRAESLLEQGVSLADPTRLDVRGSVQCGRDVFVDINVIFEGSNTLGEDVYIGAGCIVKNCTLGAGTVVHPYSVLEGVACGKDVSIGPFARLRPETRLADATKVGNFVEIKNTQLGAGSKANHLAYLGDAVVGHSCNIGAGVITCNYDGVDKHQTQIDDDVFVGSDVQLVAPVHLHSGVTIGAGATITKDVPENTLALSRIKQRHVEQWQRPTKSKNAK